MEKFTETEIQEAKRFIDFYENTVDNVKDSFKYHLSEGVVLDWFGKTVKGIKNITSFINSKTAACTHHFTNAKPVEKIGFRDSHIVNLPITSKVESKVPEEYTAEGERTPPNPVRGTNSKLLEQGQGDGLHNCLESSPVKKSRVESDQQTPVKYVTAEGFLEFRGPTSKKLQRKTRWSRPCKLHVAYTRTGFEDCTIHLIIYEGNVKCRRNLLKDFDAGTSE